MSSRYGQGNPNPTGIITFSNNAAVDANSRLRVVNPETLFATNFEYDLSTMVWTSVSASVTSSVSHLPNESALLMTLGTSANEYIRTQTRQYLRVPVGKSINYIMSFVMGSAVANTVKRVGFFDNNNGLFFEQAGDGTLSFVKRTYTGGSVAEERVTQRNWNKDTLDGSGVSCHNIDMTKIHALSLDYFWPSGRIRCGFRCSGSRITAHEFYTTNNLTTSPWTTCNLPIRFEITGSKANAGSSTMKQYHASARIEGGLVGEGGRFFSTGSSNVTKGVTTRIPLITIRPRATFNGITNRGTILIKDIDILATDNSCYWELVYSGSLTSPTYKNVDGTYSIAECDLVASAISGGLVIASGFCAANTQGQSKSLSAAHISIIDKIPICLIDQAGTAGVPISVVVTSMNGTSNVAVVMCWEEFR